MDKRTFEKYMKYYEETEMVYYMPQFDQIIITTGGSELITFALVFGEVQYITLGEL